MERDLASISDLDKEAMESAKAYTDKLAAPPGSLGKLYAIGHQFAGITGNVRGNKVEKKRVIVLCADNGVVEEGVSSAPKSVTVSQAINMTRRLTGMSSLAKHFGCDVDVVDMGIDADYNCPQILDYRIRKGTGNIAKGPAMTKEEALTAIGTGILLAKRAKKDQMDIIGVGEMGIGNTSTSSAVLSALTGCSAEEVTGFGGGLTPDAFEKKKRVIEQAVRINAPDKNDVLDVIAKVGGLDIAAMCGVFLGAAMERLPVVIDGFISIVAALCAYRLSPLAKGYMIPSHVSVERGYLIAQKEIGLHPFLDLDMRLGEGSGCPMAFQVVEASCAIMNEMASFEEAAINDDYLTEVRKVI
ncbi:MAG: nicotinate-nucleotide--dimethylbenzimidazole phosphoribosyltransferase [Lachnospiraceae bacterium]|nr:nicotinate-nucleotide--dimethylbenzimidazole phosphoribosyltransferase [Lachnospiraceae bacterium]